MTLKIKISQFYDQSEPKQWNWSRIWHFSMGHVQIWCDILFYQKILNYLNDFQNQNFSVLWLKWTQTIQVKQNQTFFHGTYSNLMWYIFLSKNIKVFQWLSKSKFLSFITKGNSNKKKMKQYQTLSMGHIQIWHHFALVAKYFSDLRCFIRYFNDFLIGIFEFHCKSEHKQVKSNKIKPDMCKFLTVLEQKCISFNFFP